MNVDQPTKDRIKRIGVLLNGLLNNAGSHTFFLVKIEKLVFWHMYLTWGAKNQEDMALLVQSFLRQKLSDDHLINASLERFFPKSDFINQFEQEYSKFQIEMVHSTDELVLRDELPEYVKENTRRSLENFQQQLVAKFPQIFNQLPDLQIENFEVYRKVFEDQFPQIFNELHTTLTELDLSRDAIAEIMKEIQNELYSFHEQVKRILLSWNASFPTERVQTVPIFPPLDFKKLLRVFLEDEILLLGARNFFSRGTATPFPNDPLLNILKLVLLNRLALRKEAVERDIRNWWEDFEHPEQIHDHDPRSWI